MKNNLQGIICMTLLCGSNLIMSGVHAEDYVKEMDRTAVSQADSDADIHNGLSLINESGHASRLNYDNLKIDLKLAVGQASGIDISTAEMKEQVSLLKSAETVLEIKNNANISIINESDKKSSFGINMKSGNQKQNIYSNGYKATLVFDGPLAINTVAEKRTAYGIHGQAYHSYSHNEFVVNDETKLSISGEKGVQGIYLYSDKGASQNLSFNKSTEIKSDSKLGNGFGIFSETRSGAANTVNFNNLSITITSENQEASNFGIFLDSKDAESRNIINISNGFTYKSIAAAGDGVYALGAFSTKDSKSVIDIEGATAITTNVPAASALLSAGTGSEIFINRKANNSVKIIGDVQTAEGASSSITLSDAESYFRGNYDTDASSYGSLNVSNRAVWSMTGGSKLTDLTLNNDGVIDMQADGGAFSTLHTKNLTGNDGVIKMDMDPSLNSDNSDRLYVAGKHEGNHYITLNNISVDGHADGAEGTVLVSVGNEQGAFQAKPREGKLFWQIYELASKSGTTEGYSTDWYLKRVENVAELPNISQVDDHKYSSEEELSEHKKKDESASDKDDFEEIDELKKTVEQEGESMDEPGDEVQLDNLKEIENGDTSQEQKIVEPSAKESTAQSSDGTISETDQSSKSTTSSSVQGINTGHTASVTGVMSVNSLNYHTWRTENDRLLQRIGELRNNGDVVKGVWLRTTGSKIRRDDSFSFQNKYNSYEVGYDEITKETNDVERYQGVALSYVDGSSSYKNGSGANHGKSISFYSTDKYSSGHYLDVVLKLSHLDNDFHIADTNGNLINGEYENMGAAVSAEYGLKNQLKHDWYVEPQAQLTLGYLGGDEYRTSNDISVKQSGIKSAVGRVGFNIGRNIDSKGVVYAKANLFHEFGGSYDVVMSDGQDRLKISDGFDDTWLEYGLGVDFEMSKGSYIYLSAERSIGSSFKKEWQWNAGVRYSF